MLCLVICSTRWYVCSYFPSKVSKKINKTWVQVIETPNLNKECFSFVAGRDILLDINGAASNHVSAAPSSRSPALSSVSGTLQDSLQGVVVPRSEAQTAVCRLAALYSLLSSLSPYLCKFMSKYSAMPGQLCSVQLPLLAYLKICDKTAGRRCVCVCSWHLFSIEKTSLAVLVLSRQCSVGLGLGDKPVNVCANFLFRAQTRPRSLN